MKNIKWAQLILSIIISLSVGGLSGFLTSNNMDTYKKYHLPMLAPPGFVFPVVWTILFILMGISAYIVLNSTASNKEKANALFLYGLQLVINFLWPLIFFKFELVFLGFLWILLLLAVVAFMIVSFYKINPLSAYLQIPYFLWLLFAAYLNIGIYVLNK